MNVEVVIPAKNEMRNLPQVFSALKSQTLQPTRVIFVDDGSTDDSAAYVRNLGYTVIQTGHKEYRERGSPELASMFNLGLREVSEAADYVLVLAGDHVIPNDYVQRLVEFMQKNNVALSSGVIEGEVDKLPRGSGRIVDAKAWRNVMCNIHYPENFGFETYLVLKLESCGYRVAVLPNLDSRILRTTGKQTKQVNYGRAMKWLGYTTAYMLYRSLITTSRSKNPIRGIQMIWGYVAYHEKSDVAEYLTRKQRDRVYSKFIRILRGKSK